MRNRWLRFGAVLIVVLLLLSVVAPAASAHYDYLSHTVQGRIVDEFGNGVQGALVTWGVYMPTGGVYSGADGYFSVTASLNTYEYLWVLIYPPASQPSWPRLHGGFVSYCEPSTPNRTVTINGCFGYWCSGVTTSVNCRPSRK